MFDDFEDYERDSYLFDDDEPTNRSGSSHSNDCGKAKKPSKAESIAWVIVMYTVLAGVVAALAFVLWLIIKAIVYIII